ncbi:MAG: ArsR family transcriptional regulator [Acidobacteria bacterium]|nr:MAG: ArsR family transcriptional regulator [Acidobacteriota bacterium]REK02645.1 MAG: ArsR family transcriptional regulator [Acidobacteriota bacterium]REK13551.1 MAG: ArsR family transcriptional regulator [Acidobacteriota bacterium]REK41545.1 MAG: ArsR family transcriptional regulator [Acidobacteriota bacterium]
MTAGLCDDLLNSEFYRLKLISQEIIILICVNWRSTIAFLQRRGMKRTKISERFFESTRGKIVLLLRGSRQTVSELSEKLGVTSNAVRSNLLSLERDGFVRQFGLLKGTRKPHYVYGLTSEAGKLFPKGYDALLIHLLSAFKSRFPQASVDEALEATGRDLAVPFLGNGLSPKDRASNAIRALQEMGGIVNSEEEEGGSAITSEGCPFSKAVSAHPEICRTAKSMLSEITGVDVEEKCDRSGAPRCRFLIPNKNSSRSK